MLKQGEIRWYRPTPRSVVCYKVQIVGLSVDMWPVMRLYIVEPLDEHGKEWLKKQGYEYTHFIAQGNLLYDTYNRSCPN